MAQRIIAYDDMDIEISYMKHHARMLHDDKRYMVFLHGWGSNKELMHTAFKHVFCDYTHYYIDLPGFGASSHGNRLGRALNTRDYAHIVLAFLRSVEVSDSVLVGHSFGGKVAMLCAQLERETNASDEIDFASIRNITTAQDGLHVKHTLNAQDAIMATSNPSQSAYIIKDIILLSSAGIVRKKPFIVHAKIACAKLARRLGIPFAFLRASDARGLEPMMYETFKRVVDEDFSHIFATSMIDASIFWGRHDEATPLDSGEAIHALMPSSRFFVLEGDHYFFITQARRIEQMYSAVSLHIIVRGIVQGVGYRKFAKERADALGIKGSAQNLPDGSVEVFAHGDKSHIEQFCNDLRSGPSKASVKDISTAPCECKQEWLDAAFCIIV